MQQAEFGEANWTSTDGKPLPCPGPPDRARGRKEVSRAQQEMCVDRAFAQRP